MLIDVKIKFENHLRRIFADNEEKRNFVLNHERKEFVLQNVCRQIFLCEQKATLARKRHPIWYFDKVIESCAVQFAHLCIKHRDEQNLSSIEKLRLNSESTKWKDAQDEMDEEVKHIELQANK